MTRPISSICSAGREDKLPRVRLRTFFPSRNDSRSKMAGGELRLGILAIYMGTIILNCPGDVKGILFMPTPLLTCHLRKLVDPGASGVNYPQARPRYTWAHNRKC